jgi:hypothetical protein
MNVKGSLFPMNLPLEWYPPLELVTCSPVFRLGADFPLINSLSHSIPSHYPNLELPEFKRQRRYGTKNYYLRMGAHLWGCDWHQYRTPGKRVHLWSWLLLLVCRSVKIGEYIKSTSPPDSCRGLYLRVNPPFVVPNRLHGRKLAD